MTGRRGGLRAEPPLRNSPRNPASTRRLVRSALGERLLLNHFGVEHCDLRCHPLLGDVSFLSVSRGFLLLLAGSTSRPRATTAPRCGATPGRYSSGPSRYLADPNLGGTGPSPNGCWTPAGGRRTRLDYGGPLPANCGCARPATTCLRRESLLPVSHLSTGPGLRPEDCLLPPRLHATCYAGRRRRLSSDSWSGPLRAHPSALLALGVGFSAEEGGTSLR